MFLDIKIFRSKRLQQSIISFIALLFIYLVIITLIPTIDAELKRVEPIAEEDAIVNSPTCVPENMRMKEKKTHFYMIFLHCFAIFHLPAGLLADKFGAKYILMISISIAAVLLIIIPFCIKFLLVILILYGLVGLCLACLYPAVASLLAKWIPFRERGTLCTFVMSAGMLGISLALIFRKLQNLIGCKAIYIIIASFMLIFVIVCQFFCSSYPAKLSKLKTDEREYLIQEMGTIDKSNEKFKFPWKLILINQTIWSLYLMFSSFIWLQIILIEGLPKIFQLTEMSTKSSELFMIILFFLVWLIILPYGILNDYINRRGWLSAINLRCSNTFFAAVMASVLLIFISDGSNSLSTICALICFLVITSIGFYVGSLLSPIDLSRNYAGTIMGAAITFGSSAFISLPLFYSWLTKSDVFSFTICRQIAWVTFAVLILTGVIYYFYMRINLKSEANKSTVD